MIVIIITIIIMIIIIIITHNHHQEVVQLHISITSFFLFLAIAQDMGDAPETSKTKAPKNSGSIPTARWACRFSPFSEALLKASAVWFVVENHGAKPCDCLDPLKKSRCSFVVGNFHQGFYFFWKMERPTIFSSLRVYFNWNPGWSL